MEPDGWSLDDLVDLVRIALESETGSRAIANRRVRELPDRRAIRWYTTIGLVDRPLTRRGGGGARYGRRHLRQIVAIKRLQAAGRSLAEIQATLVGASDEDLLEIAKLPPSLTKVDWVGRRGHSANRFWIDPPLRATAAETDVDTVSHGHFQANAVPSVTPNNPSPATAVPTPAGPLTAVPLTAVTLPGGVSLVLPAVPDAEDLLAIAAAAVPLLAVLESRGLLPKPRAASSTSDDRRSLA